MITSVCERVRARQVAFSRVWSRLVAQFFFFCSGTFGRVLPSFFVICRTKTVFSGMAGNGRLRHWLGSRLLRMVPAPGAGCASCHDIRFKLVCNCGRAAAAFVYVPHNCTSILRSLRFHGISGCIPDYCVSRKAKSLKQLRPGLIEQSRTERGQRVRDLTRPAHASLFERLPNNLFAGRFDSAAADGVTRLPEYVVRTLCFSHSLLIVYPLSSSQIIGTHPFLCDWPAGNGEEEKAEQAVSISLRFVYFFEVGEAFAGGSFGAGREVENLDREPAGVVEVAKRLQDGPEIQLAHARSA